MIRAFSGADICLFLPKSATLDALVRLALKKAAR